MDYMWHIFYRFSLAIKWLAWSFLIDLLLSKFDLAKYFFFPRQIRKTKNACYVRQVLFIFSFVIKYFNMQII